jgi:hypothetical protein
MEQRIASEIAAAAGCLDRIDEPACAQRIAALKEGESERSERVDGGLCHYSR